jgi:hypothetical protein
LICRAKVGVVRAGQAAGFDGEIILIAKAGQQAVPIVDFPVQVLLDIQAFAANIGIARSKPEKC